MVVSGSQVSLLLCFPGGQHDHHLGICQKWKFLVPSPNLLNQQGCRWGPAVVYNKLSWWSSWTLKVENCFGPQWLTLFHFSEMSRADPMTFKLPTQTPDFTAFCILASMEIWRWWLKLLFIFEAQKCYFISSSVGSDPSGKTVSQKQGQKGLFNLNLLLGLLKSSFDFWSFPKELGQIELIKFWKLLRFPYSHTDLTHIILNFWAFIFA